MMPAALLILVVAAAAYAAFGDSIARGPSSVTVTPAHVYLYRGHITPPLGPADESGFRAAASANLNAQFLSVSTGPDATKFAYSMRPIATRTIQIGSPTTSMTVGTKTAVLTFDSVEQLEGD